ncbi:MAG: hypothetical protein K8L99_06985 [Anaerolineae bacterium]|nr:hypothetical protein [Anaerolineae bacterium]
MEKQNHPVFPEYRIVDPSPVFAEALRADSNYEMDWLWVAAKVSSQQERQYCLERALYINPESAVVRQSLAAVAATIAKQLPETRPQTESNHWFKLITRFVAG